MSDLIIANRVQNGTVTFKFSECLEDISYSHRIQLKMTRIYKNGIPVYIEVIADDSQGANKYICKLKVEIENALCSVVFYEFIGANSTTRSTHGNEEIKNLGKMTIGEDLKLRSYECKNSQSKYPLPQQYYEYVTGRVLQDLWLADRAGIWSDYYS